MMQKKPAMLAGLMAFSLLLSACGGSGGSGAGSGASGSQNASQSASKGSGKTYTMIIANSTCHDTQEALGNKFVSLVQKASNGQIKGAMHSCSALGGNTQVLQGLQSNSIQATINPTAFLSTFVPQIGVLGMPWLFPGKTLGDVIKNETKVMQKGQAAKKIESLASAKGFHIVSMFGLSPNLFFSRKPITKVADFKGKKIRVVPGKEHVQTLKDWGGVPVAMAFSSVYTSLQEGTIFGVEDPPDVALKMKFPEVAPYVAVTKHNAFVEYVAVSKKWYDALPAKLQQAVDKAGQQLDQVGTQQYAANEAKALATLSSNPKYHVYHFTQAQLAKLKQLNQNGVWKVIQNDPKTGPMLTLLKTDVKNILGK